MDITLNIIVFFFRYPPIKCRTLFPVMRRQVIKDLNTVGLPGLDPASTQQADVCQPAILLAQ